ncbi:MAG: hypothetical protein KJN79_00650 [Gammaproteobacteria bacterium]|nr:hypothetical protein [Gammaproteobacteria bacterium]
MPASVVRSKEDERHWQEAKKQAAQQGKAGNYALTMHLFQRMSGKPDGRTAKSLSDRLADLLKARKPIPGQMGLFGGPDVSPKKPRATRSGAGPFIGPRGGKWADAKHTIPWKEGGEAAPAKAAARPAISENNKLSMKHHKEVAQWHDERRVHFSGLARKTERVFDPMWRHEERRSLTHVADAHEKAARAHSTAAQHYEEGHSLASGMAGDAGEAAANASYWEDVHQSKYGEGETDSQKRDRAKRMRGWELDMHQQEHARLETRPMPSGPHGDLKSGAIRGHVEDAAGHLKQAQAHHEAASQTRSKVEHRRHHDAYREHLYAAAGSRGRAEAELEGKRPTGGPAAHKKQRDKAWNATQKIKTRAAKRAAAKEARKSLSDRLSDRLQKAPMSGALKQGKPAIPKGMKFSGGPPPKGAKVDGAAAVRGSTVKPPAGFSGGPPPKGAKVDGAAAVRGSTVKPPAGFTPIPHSKKGGYHKQMGAGKYIYWYPGQGIVGDKHEADAQTTPHQEATAKHVMDQITALEQKGKISPEELKHTQVAIRNAWPEGPGDVPPQVMEHYKKLQGMVSEGGDKGDESPDVKIKREGKEPATADQIQKERAMDKEVEAQRKQSRKEAAEFKRETKDDRAALRKQATEAKRAELAKVITDPKKVPKDFNKLPKMERAKMTAHWDHTKEKLEKDFPRADYVKHPDMRQAIGDHIDQMVDDEIIVPANAQRAKDMLTTQLEHATAAGLSQKQIGTLLEENARKLAFQEKETLMRSLGDHGIRHLSVNAKSAQQIFDELEKGGIQVSPMDRLMASQVMIDHDMGYCVDVIAKGGFAIRDNYHPQASAVLARQQRAKYSRLFGQGNMKGFFNAIETHSGSAVDWRGDKLGSAVRLADNTHLFHDKFPEVLFDSKMGVEVLTKIKLAGEVVPPTATEIDDQGKERKVRTPEEKKKYEALIGGVRSQLHDAVMARKDLPPQSKKLLAKAVGEIGETTVKFTVGRLAGRQPKYKFDRRSGDMVCDIEQSNARHALGEIFGNDQTDEQFGKMLGDFGASPADAKNPKPPPQAAVRVGGEGNGIQFKWRAPTEDNPTEKRFASVMRDTKARLGEIQAMEGPAKHAAIKRFFGAELAKAMEALMGKWTQDDLHKASAMATQVGSAPEAKKPGMGIKERLKTAVGRRPPGAGWAPVPGGAKGGYRKMDRGKWVYWYPGMAKEGAPQHEAERHQAKRDIAHHDKQAAKWQGKAAKRSEQGQARDHVDSARDKMHHHAQQAESLRQEFGVRKSEEPTMEKAIRVNRCTVHLDHDAALSKSLEDGALGIGTVPRTFSSKTMKTLRKGIVGGEGFTERGGDLRETVARQQQDEIILRDDPAGNCGNGGLDSWFADAQKTQEPAVRTPIVMSKSDQGQVNVIDDSDPYTRRMHQADPREKSAFDIDYAFNRDAKRTQ